MMHTSTPEAGTTAVLRPTRTARRAGPARIDLGRLAVVPLAAVLLGLNAMGAVNADVGSLTNVVGVMRAMAQLLTAAFYLLVITLYFRRLAPTATTASWSARIASVFGSWLPMALPLLAKRTQGVGALTVSSLLILAGLGWSLWSLRTLGRSFSVLPQARRVVSSGPYRWVRHPLYIGELVAALGLVVASPGILSATAWLILATIQAYRTVHEERILVLALGDYALYQSRTARLIPRVF